MNFFKLVLATLILFIIISVGLFIWWSEVSSAIDPNNSETQEIVIPKGWTVEKIAQELKNEQLIKNELAFKLLVIKEGISQNLQAGNFRLNQSMNLYEIAQALTLGIEDIVIIIPEGLRREEIIQIIIQAYQANNVILDEQLFWQETKDLEGFLFPDTYSFSKDNNIKEIIKILNNNFEKKFNSLDFIKSGLTKKQLVILASLVEREAKHDQDRKIIAGILLKRLKKGWPLQVDATVQYAKADLNCRSWITGEDCQWWPNPLYKEDLVINSSYNTYINLDLPPAPICNPGLAALVAVTMPQDTEYWFYISDSLGTMHYAKTLEEHEENINQYIN